MLDRCSKGFILALVAVCLLVTTVVMFRMNSSTETWLQPPSPKQLDNAQSSSSSDDKTQLKLVFTKDSSIVLTPQMSAKEQDANFFNYIQHLHYYCEDYVRLGHSFDGGWDMCVVAPYRPVRPCLIYSFGISYDFSFDDVASVKYGCTIRSFDPSMKDTANHRRGPNIWFYQVGIGGKDEVTASGWTLRTLDTLIKDYNDTEKTIDYLKMDVESAEWGALANILASNVLDRVKQFGLEIHVTSRSWYDYWATLDQLEKRGFRRWYWAMNFRGQNIYMDSNGARTCCYEMVYINTKFLLPTKTTT